MSSDTSFCTTPEVTSFPTQQVSDSSFSDSFSSPSEHLHDSETEDPSPTSAYHSPMVLDDQDNGLYDYYYYYYH